MRSRLSLELRVTLSTICLFTAAQLCYAQSNSTTAAPSITVYWAPGQTPFLSPGATGLGIPIPTSLDSKLQVYNTKTLLAPPPPGNSALPTAFDLAVKNNVPSGASIQQSGSFFGFSVEMSVVNQVLGKNSSLLQVPFLNLMANIQQRVGRINVRVGGNTQETATLVANTPDGKILEKDYAASTNPTLTPPLVFTSDVLYMMRNISDFVNVHWYIGVPFNDTQHWRLQIVEQGQAILGDYLIGVQAGNEPDLYGPHGHRPESYNQQDYFDEFGLLIKALDADASINASNLLIAPSVSSRWTPESVLQVGNGFIPAYNENLYAIAVEHYPFDNCGVAFPNTGIPVVNPQDLMPVYLSHQAALNLVAPYLTTSATAQAAGKPFIMFETNTASCGGFPGLSDAFVAALWGLDYAMQMAASNFTNALFHIGGQSVTYSPFTPPPTNESVFHQWSVGPIYYSALATAEALGATNTSQIVDLNANGGNHFTPAYGIWEHGTLSRVLLINFANDPTGASDISVDITVEGGTLPSSVDVKYLLAANVTQKGNYTWAGQTLGGNFQADGSLYGTENITTIPCGVPSDGSTQTAVCRVSVPAPGAALVFLSGTGAQADVAGAPSTTFTTSTYTNIHASLWVTPSELANSQGRGGVNQQLGSTSFKSFKERGGAIHWCIPSLWMSLMVILVLAAMQW